MFMHWYYRCEIKGIQNFVMRGAKLREVVGGSALIESMFSGDDDPSSLLQLARQTILSQYSNATRVEYCAAGGATLSFMGDQSEEALRLWIAQWPLWVEDNIPGVHLVQAWVSKKEVTAQHQGRVALALAERLAVARQKPMISLPLMNPVIDRGVRGGAASEPKDIGRGERQFVDRVTARQIDAANTNGPLQTRLKERFYDERAQGYQLPFDYDDICKEGDYLAVIHIDGNRVGRLLRHLNTLKSLRDFSNALTKATLASVKHACDTALIPRGDQTQGEKSEKEKFLLGRPIVVGGDDVTAVVRADRALDFTRAYIQEFEQRSKVIFQQEALQATGQQLLTACAGIALIRKNHPFKDALHLAEGLCKYAKKAWHATCEEGEIEGPSFISFQRVTVSLAEIDQPKSTEVGHRAGPYYIDGGVFTKKAEERRFLCLETLEELAKACLAPEVSQGRLRGLIDIVSQANSTPQKLFQTGGAEREWERIQLLHQEREMGAHVGFWSQGVLTALKNLTPHFYAQSQQVGWDQRPWVPIWGLPNKERLGSPWVDVYELIGSKAVMRSSKEESE